MMLKSIPQNHDLIEKLVDYIKLNKAAIFGVPYWSCYLTLRYFFNNMFPPEFYRNFEKLYTDMIQFYSNVQVTA